MEVGMPLTVYYLSSFNDVVGKSDYFRVFLSYSKQMQ